jgi:uncharacterized protein (TIGR02145 family)
MSHKNYMLNTILICIITLNVSCGKNTENMDKYNSAGNQDKTFQYLSETEIIDSTFFAVLETYITDGSFIELERLYVLSDKAKRESIIDGVRKNNDSELFINCYYEDISDSLFITEIYKILANQNALDLFKYLKNEISSEGGKLLLNGGYRRKTLELIEIIAGMDFDNTSFGDSLMFLKNDVHTYVTLDSLKNILIELSVKEIDLSKEIESLEEYVEENDYFYGGANIVGKLSNNSYEVTEQTRYQGLKRYVLITKETEFTSNGRFNLHIRNAGYTDVQLKSGFTEKWLTLIEVTPEDRKYIDTQKDELKIKKQLYLELVEAIDLCETNYYTSLNRLDYNSKTGFVSDVDGNKYKTVKIGDQWWMAENLRVIHYRDGTTIPNETDGELWLDLNSGAYSYPNSNEENVHSCGILYNWYAVNDIRNIAPEGWRVATDDDWNELELFIGKSQNVVDKTNQKRGKDQARKLKSIRGWSSGRNGINEFAFSALPCGMRSYYENGRFLGYGMETTFWADTEEDDQSAYMANLAGSDSEIISNYGLPKQNGASVRCIKGERPNKSPVASFTISPNLNSTDTSYIFYTINASKSNDYENDISELQFRWDFNSNGNWDSDWSFDATTSYGFHETGTFKITLEVQDTEGAIGVLTSEVNIIKYGTVTDIDGNVYKTIYLGSQVWMAENLKVTHYRNGVPIPNIENGGVGELSTVSSYSYYDNDRINMETYGALYNWYAVNDIRNIAPEGWRVATDDDWNELELFIGSQSATDSISWRDKEAKIMRSRTGWRKNLNGTDDIGFCALPAGSRGFAMDDFNYMGRSAKFWSATEWDSRSALSRSLSSSTDHISRGDPNKLSGYSVRCVKD